MQSHASALVLEDNKHMRFLLTQLLQNLEVARIDAVGSTSDARAHLECLSYDFALVDVGLSGESGLDFLRALRLTPDHPARRMPVIIVSGQNQMGVIKSARDAGADAFLTKPISESMLARGVRQVLETPRRYIETDTYFGPDRRRRDDPGYDGPERRKSDDWYI